MDLSEEDSNEDLMEEEPESEEEEMGEDGHEAVPTDLLDEEPDQGMTATSSTTGVQISNSQSLIARIGVSVNDKAGLQNVDAARANQVIYDMSKNSKFFLNEQRKQLQVKERVVRLLQQAKQTKSLGEESAIADLVDSKVAHLEVQRDLTQTWLHVDLDAFFAAVEIRDDPSLKGKPVAVGGNSMLSTASYEARKFGVRSAMPGFIAKELCPDLIIVPGRMEAYKEASRLTREVYAKFDPHYEPLSMDEASLSITAYLETHSDTDAEAVAQEIRDQIFQSTKLTASVGIAPNKRLAKICADKNKPNGQFYLPSERQQIMDFISPLACRKIGGVGKVTDQMLQALNIRTFQDLREQRVLIYKLFPGSFEFFMKAAYGLGKAEHSIAKPRKSIGAQRTFKDTKDSTELLKKCEKIAESVSKSLRKRSLKAKKVVLLFKSAEFQLKSKTASLPKYVDDKEAIYQMASKMLSAEFPLNLRLLGIRMSGFKDSQTPASANQGTLERFVKPGVVPTADPAISTSTPPRPAVTLKALFLKQSQQHPPAEKKRDREEDEEGDVAVINVKKRKANKPTKSQSTLMDFVQKSI